MKYFRLSDREANFTYRSTFRDEQYWTSMNRFSSYYNIGCATSHSNFAYVKWEYVSVYFVLHNKHKYRYSFVLYIISQAYVNLLNYRKWCSESTSNFKLFVFGPFVNELWTELKVTYNHGFETIVSGNNHIPNA